MKRARASGIAGIILAIILIGAILASSADALVKGAATVLSLLLIATSGAAASTRETA